MSSVDQLMKALEEKVLPVLRLQDGFQDQVCLLSSDTTKAIVISFWGSQEQANTYAGTAYVQILESVKHLLEEPPVARSYDVLNSTFYKTIAKATT
ncbi:MAG TPA: hypothetical protein VFE36_08765 [Candidatus Baltobacteraceae bacterium]|jgi:hypothetical protein|nr:hypothetical protein [Candidatus Baltobacteraceae bacterium]